MTRPARRSAVGQAGRAAVVYVGLSAAQRGASLLLLPFVTRAMQPAEFGAVAVLLAIATLASVVLGSAFETIVFRAAARDDPDSALVLSLCRRWLFGWVPLVGLAGASALAAGDWTVLGVHAHAWAAELLAVCLMTSVVGFALALLRAREKLALFAIVSSVTIVGIVSMKVIFVVLAEGGVMGWATSDLVAATIAFVVSGVASRVPRAPGDRAVRRRVVQFTLPLVPHRLAFWALALLDRLLLAAMVSHDEIGVYALAANLSTGVILVLGELNRAVLVEYARAEFPAPSGSLVTIVRSQLLAAVVVPATALTVISLLQGLLIGPGYEDALSIMAVLVVAQVCSGLYLIPTNLVLQTAGRTSLAWGGSILGVLVVIAGSLAFGPAHGVYAVASALGAGYLVMALFAVWLVGRNRLDVRWRRMWPGTPAALVAGGGLVVAVAPFAVEALPSRSCAAVGLVLCAAATLLFYRSDVRGLR